MASTFTPAGSAPPGQASNFENPTDTLYPEIVATVTVSIILTTSFTAARLIAKRATSTFGVEDHFSIVTWVMFIGYSTTFMLQGNAGIGRHIWDIRAEAAPRISQLSWSIELMYCPITWFAKAALLFQIQRTFAPQKSGMVYASCQILIWGNLVFYTGSLFALIFECIPQEKIWNPDIISGHCIKTGDLLIAMGIINVISDLMILILPIWAIFHLHLSTKLKLGVSAIFTTGILACVCSICRLVYTFPPLHSEDVSYLFAPVGLWSLAEMTSIILCTSFPLMPRFWKVVRGRYHNNIRISQHYQYATSNSHAVGISGRGKCLNCQRRIPCTTHEVAHGCSNCEDEERLYVHKSASHELERGGVELAVR